MILFTNALAVLALAASLYVLHLSDATTRAARAVLADSAAQHEQAQQLYDAAATHFERASVLWRLMREGCVEETHP